MQNGSSWSKAFNLDSAALHNNGTPTFGALLCRHPPVSGFGHGRRQGAASQPGYLMADETDSLHIEAG